MFRYLCVNVLVTLRELRSSIFFYISILAVSPIVACVRFAMELEDFEAANPGLADLREWGMFKTCMWPILLATVGVGVVLALLLKSRFEPASVRWIKTYLLAAPLVYIGSEAILFKVLFNQFPAENYAPGLIGAYVAGGLWMWYFTASKGVRNTYYPLAVASNTSTSSLGTKETPST
jgi:hypothetical protein